jgi:putative flippase GtrA
MALDLRSPIVVKLAKYSTASFAGLVVGQTVLFLCYQSLGWAAIPANLMSVTLGAIPNYLINRRWTWHQTGKNRLWGEVIPFWVMSALGMIVSLFTVAYAEDRWDTALAVGLAQVFGFGLLWIAKFLVLDKVMWKIVHDLQPDVAIDEGEAGLIGALSLDGSHGERPTPDQVQRNGGTTGDGSPTATGHGAADRHA